MFSDALLCLLLLTYALYFPARYNFLAAFELLTAGIIFAWIIVFVRHLAGSKETTLRPVRRRSALEPSFLVLSSMCFRTSHAFSGVRLKCAPVIDIGTQCGSCQMRV